MSKRMLRRPNRAEIERALRDLEALWRPPDPRRDNARRAPGAGKNELHDKSDVSTKADSENRGAS